MDRRAQIFGGAMLFECGLGFLGVALAWVFGLDLESQLDFSLVAVERGMIGCLPMFAMLGVVMCSRWKPVVELRQQLEEFIREVFLQSNPFELAAISAAAGIGEELLFRGALQPWLGQMIPMPLAIVVVSLLFGLAHALTPLYFVLATLISIYLGWLAVTYNDVVTPIVTHGVYDFVALLFVQDRVRRKPVL